MKYKLSFEVECEPKLSFIQFGFDSGEKIKEIVPTEESNTYQTEPKKVQETDIPIPKEPIKEVEIAKPEIKEEVVKPEIVEVSKPEEPKAESVARVLEMVPQDKKRGPKPKSTLEPSKSVVQESNICPNNKIFGKDFLFDSDDCVMCSLSMQCSKETRKKKK